jgi:hypothetical protein
MILYNLHLYLLGRVGGELEVESNIVLLPQAIESSQLSPQAVVDQADISCTMREISAFGRKATIVVAEELVEIFGITKNLTAWQAYTNF